MKETDRIARQMDLAFNGGAWHGPALGEVLDGVSPADAAAKPIPTAHSIWEIVLHLAATQELVIDRMQGIVRELSPDEDWPAVPNPTKKAWSEAKARLARNEERLREKVAALPAAQLDKPLVKGGSLAYDNLHGMVQHNLYHAGQIVMLKKAI